MSPDELLVIKSAYSPSDRISWSVVCFRYSSRGKEGKDLTYGALREDHRRWPTPLGLETGSQEEPGQFRRGDQEAEEGCSECKLSNLGLSWSWYSGYFRSGPVEDDHWKDGVWGTSTKDSIRFRFTMGECPGIGKSSCCYRHHLHTDHRSPTVW